MNKTVFVHDVENEDVRPIIKPELRRNSQA
jgi:hypothetical protein